MIGALARVTEHFRKVNTRHMCTDRLVGAWLLLATQILVEFQLDKTNPDWSTDVAAVAIGPLCPAMRCVVEISIFTNALHHLPVS